MLRLSFFELFFRLLPEGFLLCALMYILSNKRIRTKEFILTGLLLGITPFFIRLLPINFGVHTILSLVIYIALAVGVNNIDVIKSISSGLLSIVILSVCEFINFIAIVNIFKFPVEDFIDDVVIKTIMGFPSLLLFSLIVFMLNKMRYKNKVVSKVV